MTTERQQRFLTMLANRIPRLFDAIDRGNTKAEFIIGTRQVNGQQVRLKLIAEEIESESAEPNTQT